MAEKTAKRFRAGIEPLSGGLGWVVARLPFDVDRTWKRMVRLRVKVEVGGEVFRTSLFPDAHGGGHFVLVNKKMQKAAGAKVGAMVDFAIAPDLDERTPPVRVLGEEDDHAEKRFLCSAEDGEKTGEVV